MKRLREAGILVLVFILLVLVVLLFSLLPLAYSHLTSAQQFLRFWYVYIAGTIIFVWTFSRYLPKLDTFLGRWEEGLFIIGKED